MRPLRTKINVFLDSFKANGRENWPFFYAGIWPFFISRHKQK